MCCCRRAYHTQVGALALKTNMTQLGPVVLPYSEMIKFGANMAVRMAAKSSKSVAQALPASWQKQYVPDFRKAFDYFCIHTGNALCYQ